MLALAVVGAAGVLLLECPTHAATDTWVGTSALFNAGAGIAFNTAPVTGDSLVFAAAGSGGTTLTDNLLTPASFNIAAITFNSGASAFVINPAAAGTNGFTLTGNITNSGTSLETINDPITSTAVRTVTMTAGGGNVVLGGSINGSAGGITTAGTGTLTLSGTDSYTGTTTVGVNTTLTFGASNVLGSNSSNLSNVSLTSGGLTNTIDLAGTSQAFGTLTSSSTTGSGGIITSSSTGGSLTLNEGNTNANAFGGTQFTGQLAITLKGNTSGSVQFTNANNNFSGGLTVSSSTTNNFTTANLAITGGGLIGQTISVARTNVAAGFGTGRLTLDYGESFVVAALNVSNPISVTSRGGLIHMEGMGTPAAGTFGFGYSGAINNSGGLLAVNSNSGNSNTMSLWGSMANFNGTLAIDTADIGGIALGGNNTGNQNANLLWYGTATFGSPGTGKLEWNGVGSTTISFGELSNLNSGAVGSAFSGQILDNVASTTATFQIGNNTSDSPVFQGSINNGSGTVAFTKVGTNTQTLSGVNNYTGATNVSAGTLIITGSLNASSAVTVNSGGSLKANGSGIIAGPVTVNGGGQIGGTGTVSGLVTLATGSTSASQGQINLTGTAGTFNISNSAGLTLGGTAGNAASIDIDAANKVAITGPLIVNSGGASIYVTPGTATAGTSYTLMTFANGSGGGFSTGVGSTVGSLVLADPNISFGVTGSLNVSNGSVMLTTTGATAPLNAYWSGTQGIHWTDTNSGGTAGNFTTDQAGTTFAAALPGPSTNVFFAGNSASNLTTNVLGQAFDINSLTFQNGTGAVVIGGSNSLQIEAGGITVNNTAGDTISTSSLVLGAAQTWTNNNSAPLTITSAVSGSAGLTIVGAVSLGGASFSTGSLAVNGSLDVKGTSISTGNLSGSGSITNTGASNAVLTSSTTGTSTYSGTLADGGTGKTISLIKNGAGTLTLSGSNSYIGSTTINAGTLALGNGSALGTSSTIVVGGATLDLGGQTITNALTVSGTGVGAAGALINSNTSSTAVVNADMLLSPSFTIGGAGNITLQRVQGSSTFTVTDAASGALTLGTSSTTNQNNLLSLVVSNGGTVYLNMPANFIAIDRGLTITNGTVQLTGASNDEITTGGPINLSSGTLDFNGHAISAGIGALLGTGGTVTNTAPGSSINVGINSSTTNTYAGTITDGVGGGVVSVSLSGTGGIETFSGTNNYSGGTTINPSGTLIMGSATALGTVAAPLTITGGNNASGGTLDLKGNSLTVSSLTGSAGSNGGTAGSITSSGNTGAILSLTVNNSGSNNYAGQINNGVTSSPDVLSLVKNGAGTLTLSGASNFSGGTTINNGVVAIVTSTSLGSGPIVIGDGSSANPASLQLTGAGYNVANGIIVAPGGTGVYSIVSNTNQDFTFTGALNLSNSLTVTDTQPHAIFLDGAISSGASNPNLTVSGGGVGSGNNFIALQGVNSAFTGNLLITNNGFVKTHTGALSAANEIIMDSTARLDTGAVSLTVAGLQDVSNGSGGSTIVNAGTGSDLTLAGSGNYYFSGAISNSGYLTKPGTGMQTLAGSNTYAGATIISGGTLLAGSSAGLSSVSAFNVSGGILDTGGYASTIAAINVAAPGSLNLNLAGGALTVTGAAVLNGSLNLYGAPTSFPETLINYGSLTGTGFPGANVTGIPTGDKLVYGYNGLNELELVTSGPGNLTWNNTGGSGDGVTWDSSNVNWNNGGGAVAYSDTSNGTTGDNVTFNDANNGKYSVTINNSGGSVHPTSVIFSATGNYVIGGVAGAGIAGIGSITLTGTGTVTLTSTNTYTGGTNVSAGKLVIASGTAYPNNGSNGTPLTIGSGATFQIAPHTSGSSYEPIASSLSNNGVIDITNNEILFTGGATYSGISAEVAAAYNGANGTWKTTGSGLITSSTVGGLTTVGVAQVAGGIEAKATYYGDALLTGSVTSADYTAIDSGFLSNLTGWQNGDFNYDGFVNGSDYTLIDNAFNTQGANLAAEIASPTAQIARGGTSSAVPEPASLGLLGIAAVGLLGRRSRRHH
jgi:autotransporter-associated beta strand protein